MHQRTTIVSQSPYHVVRAALPYAVVFSLSKAVVRLELQQNTQVELHRQGEHVIESPQGFLLCREPSARQYQVEEATAIAHHHSAPFPFASLLAGKHLVVEAEHGRLHHERGRATQVGPQTNVVSAGRRKLFPT